MRKTTALLVLTICVLGVYYPAIFAGTNSLDDFRMLDGLPRSGGLDIFSLFNPRAAAGYFRPLVIFSYYLDSSMLDLSPQAMHLENILIHLANTLLVFGVGLSVFRSREPRVEAAFAAACVFGLHPVNVEAVAWISGRTDPLAALFALLGLLTLYRFIDSGKLPWLWGSALLCLVGALAKETALFCLPAAFLLACVNDDRLRGAWKEGNPKKIFARSLPMVLPFALTGGAYLAVRLATVRYVTKNIAGASTATGGSFSALVDLVREGLTTCGFYVKKLFLPLPLNFAITHISGAYAWLGGGVVLLAVWCLARRRNSIGVQMMLATLLVLTSTLVISRARVAWTPYAERYLYLPTFFFAFGVVDAGQRLCFRYALRKTGMAAAFTVLAAMAAMTTQRATVWQSNLTLYQDTQKKSPDFGSISNELAIALTANNRLEEALVQIERGKKASNQGETALLYVNQAAILGEKKRYEEAYQALADSYRGTDIAAAHIEVIKSYINLMERDRVETKDRKRAAELMSRLADLHELYYKKSGDADHLYRAGQLALAAGDRDKAHVLFVEAAKRVPKESMYREFARKMAQKTETIDEGRGTNFHRSSLVHHLILFQPW